MNPIFTIALKTIGFNILSLLLIFADITGLILIVFSVFAQLLAAIIMLFFNEHRLIGQGMLLGVGIFGMVGFSVCSVLVMNIH
jgi:hypothetical protein